MKHDWDAGVTKWIRDGKFVIEVDTEKALFWGIKWKELGQFGKRKWENWLFLNNQNHKLPVVFCYKP